MQPDQGQNEQIGIPLVVDFQLTRACNLRCRYCHVNRTQSYPQMSLGEMRVCIGRLCSLKRPIHTFLTGGEPLLSPHLELWLSATQKHPNLTVSINTNATLLTDEIVAKLVSARIGMILVSIDGWNAHSHDWHSRVRGSFDDLIKALRLLMNSPLRNRVVTNTVLTHANVTHWPQIVDLLSRLGILRAKFSPVLIPLNVKSYSNLRLTAIDMKEYQHIRGHLRDIQNESSERFEERMCNVLLDKQTKPMECFAGRRFIFVRSDGSIFPCWQISDKLFTIRFSPNSLPNDVVISKLYALPADVELFSTVRCLVISNRNCVCLDCCDACNIFLEALHYSGVTPNVQ